MNEDSKYYEEYFAYILNGVLPSNKVKQAVFDIIKDLTSRRGLRQEFECIDGDIQDEIIEKWMSCIN